ncbi:hypothetical protein [Streptomyces niveus]
MTSTADQARDDYRNGAAQRDPKAVKNATADARRNGSTSAGAGRGQR